MTNPFVLLIQTLRVGKFRSAAYAEGPAIRGVMFNKILLDEVEQNIVICQWRADQLFASN